ncbi:MAG: 2-oxoacid:acceptor oxidoreductase family protein [Thermoplasmata archaeon]|jgi:2-oxoglutarate ferredoxin oxidoreductase subunit gamma|nr:2-oxoacid:acceptor oxidoreductase family protein [Thermoplasmata archaeon]
MDSQIRFTGFGGQGVILMGIVLARAASLYERPVGEDGKEKRMSAIQTQSYGPSARGGHSKCDVKISDQEMLYPFVEIPDWLVIMSQQAYSKYIQERRPDTKVIVDPDLVMDRPTGHIYYISATKAAESLGTRIVANVVMLGAFREISGVVSNESLERALMDALPKPTHDLNKSALAQGAKLGREAMEKKGKA